MEVGFGLEELMQLVARHIQQRPAMRVQDVYKLLYQGIREQSTTSPPQTFSQPVCKPSLPACRPIPPSRSANRSVPTTPSSGSTCAPIWLLSHDPDWLVEACLKTAKMKWGSQQDLLEVWQTFIYSVDAGYFPTISKDQACAFSIWLETQNFPPIHHSTIYQNTYRPAYRLVASQYFPPT